MTVKTLDQMQFDADRLARLLDATATWHGEDRDKAVTGALLSIAEDIAVRLNSDLEKASLLDYVERAPVIGGAA
ncbi:hypothetical protein TW83_07825 [Paracoccus sp. S4493]|uniref:hypothetical protein n=1 Tax=Paracoccus sp. S4493 TaxID=579490 RepID=UPI0005F9CA48|nr:hypothetical protein [Paracoccus sp. S4493]KJZ31566.1 hypothetical protein TW83_07825 [Paracoccus sp. S4493]